MSAREVLETIRQKFPDAIVSESTERGEASIVVVPERWIELARWLAGDGGFTFLSDLCAVDWPGREPRFEVAYHLTDMQSPRVLRAKLPVSGEPPTAPTVTTIWRAADWLEREAYDMYGIVFEGHPDLRRILMPDEWEGHPQRKDYSMGKVPVEYKQVSPGF